MSKIYRIRGHHLECLERFVWEHSWYPDGEKRYLRDGVKDEEYSRELVRNEIKIWKNFLKGKCSIELVKTLDDICLGGECYVRSGRGYPGDNSSCRGPITAKEDIETAVQFGLKIGKTYTYEEIKHHLHKHLVYHKYVSDDNFLRKILKIK